jgi:hypothetical protein
VIDLCGERQTKGTRTDDQEVDVGRHAYRSNS